MSIRKFSLACSALLSAFTFNAFSESSFDFDGDGLGDIVYRGDSDLKWRIDLMNGLNVKSSFDMPAMSSCCGWLFNGSGDFNGDGKSDVIIRNTQSGQWYIYNLDGSTMLSRGYVPIESAIYIGVQAVADFNNDGYDDVLLRNENTGEWTMTLLNNRTVLEEYLPPMSKVLTWKIVDAKDFDGNGSADILIRNKESGAWYIYLYNNTDITTRGYITTVLPTDLNEEYQAVGDFDGDGNTDVLFRNLLDNSWSVVFMNGRTPISLQSLAIEESANWELNAVNDFNGDGMADISLRNRTTESVYFYLLNGISISSEGYSGNTLRNDASAQSLMATPNGAPGDDEIMSDFWSRDLLNSQRKDIAAIAELFDDDFMETGSATVDEEDVDLVLRGCAAIRLKLRESTLASIDDELLESGELKLSDLTNEQESGYGAYVLFASLQELIISQMDP